MNRTHLDQAKAVIDQYSVVIVLEKFEEQLVQLQEVFQWKMSSQWKGKMRTTKRPKVNLTDEALAHLREQNSLDSEFYQHADQVATRLTEAARNAQTPDGLRKSQQGQLAQPPLPTGSEEDGEDGTVQRSPPLAAPTRQGQHAALPSSRRPTKAPLPPST